MITGTMTGEELFLVYKKDEMKLRYFSERKASRLTRELRKGFNTFTSACYDYKSGKANYKVCVFVDRNVKAFFYNVFIYVRDCNDYVDVSILATDAHVEQFSYTPHCLHRYAERHLEKPDMPINNILAHVEREVAYTLVIYEDGINKVVVSSVGLFLQKRDVKRKIVVNKTFVSVGMLRTSQIVAYVKVADILNKFSLIFDHVKEMPKNIHEKFNEELAMRGVTRRDLYEAYGAYFKNRNKYGKND